MDLKTVVIESRMREEPAFLELCILKLWEKQERDEQAVKDTIHSNGVGFTRSDGHYFSQVAEFLKNKQHLPELMRSICMHKMAKYTKQLSNHLTDEEAGV